MNLGIRHQISNRGIVFNQLPEMLLFISKQNKSEATFFENIASFVNPDKDKVLFKRENNHSVRKIIDGELSEKYLKDIFGENFNISSYESTLQTIDTEIVGGWTFLESNIKNMEAINEEQQQYLDFVLALCDIDKNFIIDNQGKYPKNKAGIKQIEKDIQNWLLIPKFSFKKTNKENGSELTIALILHWAALFEHFLFIEYKEQDYSSKLKKVLPINQDNGKLICSNEAFLTRFAENWIKTTQSEQKKGNLKWAPFYRDIVRAKNKNRPDFDEFKINPNTDSIKKTLTRWCSGEESFLTMESIKKDLIILYEDYDPKDFDFSLLTVVFVQLFNSIQRELENEKLPNEFIVEQFSKYPDFLNTVKRRFQNYQKTGKIKP